MSTLRQREYWILYRKNADAEPAANIFSSRNMQTETSQLATYIARSRATCNHTQIHIHINIYSFSVEIFSQQHAGENRDRHPLFFNRKKNSKKNLTTKYSEQHTLEIEVGKKARDREKIEKKNNKIEIHQNAEKH